MTKWMQCALPSGVTRRQAAIFLAASFQVLFGIATIFCNQTIFDRILESELVIKEGSTTFESWKGNPIPIYMKVYFFNMLNAEAFQERGERPVVEEKGPYTFRQVESKVNLLWHQDNTISYQRRNYWYFEPAMSAGPLTDTVVSINLPMVGAVNYARDNPILEYGISDILQTVEATLFVNKTIGELMFDGYEDPVLQMGAGFDEDTAVPMDRFGWFYKRNGTTWSDGDLRMHTGQGDIEKLGQITAWNRSNRTYAFEGECGAVTGSADGLFAPGLLKTANSFNLWSTDACRKLTFSRVGSEVVSGVTASKFKLADDVFDNGTICKENHCYDNNLPSGVQNVTQCKMKSPAFLSRPHFYKADTFFADQFQIGMEPDPEQHESFFMVEPHTSIPVKVQMALQLNIKLEASSGVEYVFKDLPTVYFPVLWFQSTAQLPGGMAGSLVALVNLPTIMVTASCVSIVLGLLGMAVILYTVRRARMNSKAAEVAASPSPRQ